VTIIGCVTADAQRKQGGEKTMIIGCYTWLRMAGFGQVAVNVFNFLVMSCLQGQDLEITEELIMYLKIIPG